MRRARWGTLLLLLVVTGVLALMLGATNIAPADIWGALVGDGRDTATVAIVRAVRLPRVLLAMLVGAALGMSGSVLQGTLRNALAEPYLLGVSGGAAVGAVVAVAAGVGAPPLIALAAFVGALGAVTAVLAIAHAAGGLGDTRLLLMSGVVVGAFANAAIMVVMAAAAPDVTRNALWWMMGSVAAAGWRDVVLLAAMLAVIGAWLVHQARGLDVLALGGDAADSLGIDAARVGRRFFVLASLLAAATVAVAGLVGFVGLMVPHLARSITGGRARPVLLAAALCGAILVVGADLAARTVRAPAELPLGAVTALVGVPFFLWRLRGGR
ncbi:MAG: iron ABC transporter permease [Gemmatimonadetes bacterium]|nr:iron ABC transporter permease [Gemmatimonadota bacterium]